MCWSLNLTVAIFAAIAFGSKAIAQCMTTDRPSETLAGTLKQDTYSDAAGRPEPAFILELPASTCLQGLVESDNVDDASKIHLTTDDAILLNELQRLLGDTVAIRGRPFGALTVHHHAPIVMSIDHVEPQVLEQPQKGSALRSQLLNTVRAQFESETRGPVEFVVRRLNVIGEWAYGEVRAQRPGGIEIDWSKTRYAEDLTAGMFDPAASDFLLRRSPSGWVIVDVAMGPTDVAWDGWRLEHNLPLTLFQW
ncbi:MAG: hypothetical protein AB7I44_18700 [Hyphomicrobiaceae bacterium]